VLKAQGKVAEALDLDRHGRDIIARLMEQSPDNATLRNHLARYDGEIAKLEQTEAAEPEAEQTEQAAR